MGIHPAGRDEPSVKEKPTEQSGSSGVVFALVALALLLAIGFFYLTNGDRDDRPADAVTNAAQSVDETVKMVGDAARKAADKLRKPN